MELNSVPILINILNTYLATYQPTCIYEDDEEKNSINNELSNFERGKANKYA